jgi:hypothetical protein
MNSAIDRGLIPSANFTKFNLQLLRIESRDLLQFRK